MERAKFFKPLFNLNYVNGAFFLAANPQFLKLLMDEIHEQGENVNLTAMIQIQGVKWAESLRDLCMRADDYFLRNLGGQFDQIIEDLRRKRLDYEKRNPVDDLDEEPLDDDETAAPSYGRHKR